MSLLESCEGKVLLGTMAGRLLLWDLLSGKILRVFRGHRSCIEASFELSGSHLSKSYVFQQLFQTWWILRVFPRKVWDTWVPTTCCSRRIDDDDDEFSYYSKYFFLSPSSLLLRLLLLLLLLLLLYIIIIINDYCYYCYYYILLLQLCIIIIITITQWYHYHYYCYCLILFLLLLLIIVVIIIIIKYHYCILYNYIIITTVIFFIIKNIIITIISMNILIILYFQSARLLWIGSRSFDLCRLGRGESLLAAIWSVERLPWSCHPLLEDGDRGASWILVKWSAKVWGIWRFHEVSWNGGIPKTHGKMMFKRGWFGASLFLGKPPYEDEFGYYEWLILKW